MELRHAPTASADRAPDDPREDRPEECANCRDAAAEQTEWQWGVLNSRICWDIGVFFDPSYMEEGATRFGGGAAADGEAKQPLAASTVAGSDPPSSAVPSADTG